MNNYSNNSRKEIERLNSLITEQQNQINHLNSVIEGLHNSTSWRLTAPIRGAKDVVKRLTGKGNGAPVVNNGIESTEVNIVDTQIETQVETTSSKDVLREYVDYIMQIPFIGPSDEEYVEYNKINDFCLEDDDVKYLTFYLPQFHSFPENDEWWGKNFTEWTNVTKSVPQFAGHYQPRLAGDLGYYNLKEKQVIAEQQRLAKEYGIYGFCIYYYWFDGKKLMETPLDIIMNNKDLDLPFCICWANENWSRRWDGKDADILIAQNYDDNFADKFIKDAIVYMRDERYIKMGGNPLLVIYNANEIPNLKENINYWREYCKQDGLGEIHIAAVDFALNEVSKSAGFDSFVEFPPHSVYHYEKTKLNDSLNIVDSAYDGDIYDYSEIVEHKEYVKGAEANKIPGVFLAWDNTARKKNASTVYHNYSPEAFGHWLSDVTGYVNRTKDKDKFVFINAWNEWAEGTYLEPDRKYGYAALEQVRNTILSQRKHKKIIYVCHDAWFNGAQMLSLNIMKTLKEVYAYDVYLILKGNGVLIDQMRDVAYEMICLEDEDWKKESLEKWIYATGADIAISNTVVSGDITKNLNNCGVRVISLIHEMENIIRDNNLEGNLEIIAENAEKIIYASDYVRQSDNNVYQMPEDKTIILPQGMYILNKYLDKRHEVKAEIYNKYGISNEQKLVLGVGFADHRKGIDLFVKAALDSISKNDNVTYMWIGDVEPGMEKLCKEIIGNSSSSSKIIFAGKQTDPMLYYTAADIFLLTSREDPFPTVVMEAMYSYLPVVAFAGGGGYVEIINDKTGKLVDMEDYLGMSKYVLNYVENEELRNKIGKYAHNFTAETFKFTKYVGDLLNILGVELPSVSVVVPNYNYEKYLPERLDCIIQQEYPVKEILLLDDCSTDNSKEVIEEYAKKYPDLIKVVMNETNSGNVFKQWSKGFELATGDYVWIAEADDLSDISFLKKVMGMINSNDDMTMCYTQSKMMDENGVVTGDNYFCYTDDVDIDAWKADYVICAETEISEHMTIKNTIPNVSGVVFKNSCYMDIFESAMNYTVAGDWRVYVDILKRGGNIGFVADSLNYHRRHSNSVTTDLKAEKHYNEIVSMQEYVAECLGVEVCDAAKKYREFLKEYFGL